MGETMRPQAQQPVEKPRFSFSWFFGSARSNKTQTAKAQQRQRNRLDARELVGVILPSCRHRPAVHNEIVRLIQRLLPRDGRVEKFELQARFIPCMPPKSVDELEKDIQLVRHLLSLTNRPANRTRLVNLQQQIQTDVDVHDEIKRDKARKLQQQSEFDLQLLSFVLEHISDRPHLYNQIVVSLHQLHHEMLYLQRRGRQSRSRKTACLTWKKEGPPSSQDRWMDVERLDELLDAIPETSSLGPILIELQQKCRKEAKRLLRQELLAMDALPRKKKGLGGMQDAPPNLIPLMSLSTDSSW